MFVILVVGAILVFGVIMALALVAAVAINVKDARLMREISEVVWKTSGIPKNDVRREVAMGRLRKLLLELKQKENIQKAAAIIDTLR